MRSTCMFLHIARVQKGETKSQLAVSQVRAKIHTLFDFKTYRFVRMVIKSGAANIGFGEPVRLPSTSGAS